MEMYNALFEPSCPLQLDGGGNEEESVTCTIALADIVHLVARDVTEDSASSQSGFTDSDIARRGAGAFRASLRFLRIHVSLSMPTHTRQHCCYICCNDRTFPSQGS